MTSISKLNFGVIIPKEIQDKLNKPAEEQDLKEQQKMLAEIEKLRAQVANLEEQKAILMVSNNALAGSIKSYESQIEFYKTISLKTEEKVLNQEQITKEQQAKTTACTIELEKTRKDLASARKSGGIKNGILVGVTAAAIILGTR